eukprot:600068-Alexandrium_andersonii.AAC.1
MEADPRHAELLAAMLGPKATLLSAPGARGSSQAQSRLDEAGAAPPGPNGSAGRRPWQVRFSTGPAAEEGPPEAVRGQGPTGST